jgi:hypothetical protein
MKYLLLFLISLLFYSCRKEATTWFSDWQTPLINDTLDLKKLTNDSTLIVSNGAYYLQLKRKIASISPVSLLTIPDTLIEQKYAIAIPNITVPPGTSFVNNNKDFVFDMMDAKIKKARIKSGQINLQIENPIGVATIFELELPSVQFQNSPLKKAVTISSGSQSNPTKKTLSIDLAGYWIDFSGTSGFANNSLPSKLKVSTEISGPTVTITNKDTTTFKMEMKALKFDYAQGYFGKHNYLDTFIFDSKILKDMVTGAIDLPSLSLKFDIENSIKVPAKATILEIKNYNSETNYTTNLSHIQIGHPFIIENPTGSWNNLLPSKKSILFDQNTSNIENFVENLGEKTTIRYAIDVNPWGNISGGWDELFPDSKLDVTTSINMPLNIGLNDLQLVDTFDLSLSQEEGKTNIESGVLSFKLENGFPFQGNLSIYFMNESGVLIKAYDVANTITSSLFGQVNAAGVKTKKSEINFELPADLIAQLASIKKIAVKVKLNSIDNSTLQNTQVSIPENAFVWIKMQSKLKLKNVID